MDQNTKDKLTLLIKNLDNQLQNIVQEDSGSLKEDVSEAMSEFEVKFSEIINKI